MYKSIGKFDCKRFTLLLMMIGLVISARSQGETNPKIIFRGVQNEKIKNAFFKVLDRYESLHQYEITLVQTKIKGSTMQAQPIVSLTSLLRGGKKFRIKVAQSVRDTDDQLVKNLPEDVIAGWFAHEMGHLVDYEPYSNFQMITYGIRYLFSSKFKRKAEYAADYIAIEHGFKSEIIASKKYLLESGLVDAKYVRKISKYYLSIADVELCTEDKIIVKPASGF